MKKSAKTETAEPVKKIIIFDAGEIEFSVKSAILKNTLPAVRDTWKNWLASYNATDLKTDEDFKDASEFVAACKQTEDKLGELEETALRGDAQKVITEIRTMRETTRTKRLEFSRAVDFRKDKIKSDAIATAVLKCRTDLSEIKYKPAIEIEDLLRTAIKGKSAFLKMNEALEIECARIMAEAVEYNSKMQKTIKEVFFVYQAAGESVTASEVDMLVRSCPDGAPERAQLILDQRRVHREQAEIDRKKREEAEEAARNAPPPATALPAAVPATIAIPGPVGNALAAAEIPGNPILMLRFGATFRTSDPEQTISLINSIGGRDIKWKEFPKQ